MSPWIIFLFPILTQGWIGQIYFKPQDVARSVESYANIKTNLEDQEKVLGIHRYNPEEIFNDGLKLYGKRTSSSKSFLDRKVEEFVKRMYRRKPVSGKIRLLRKK